MLIRWQLSVDDLIQITRLEDRKPILLRLLELIFFLALIALSLHALYSFLVSGMPALLVAAGAVLLLLFYLSP